MFGNLREFFLKMAAKHGRGRRPKSPGIRNYSDLGFNVPYAVGHLLKPELIGIA